MGDGDKKKKDAPKPISEDAGLQEFLNRLDQAGTATATSTLNFYGLPQGEEGKPYYRPPTPGTTTVQPRYYEGAEWWPVKTNMTPQAVRSLQTQLVQSGLLNGKDYTDGVWDPASREAFAEVLNMANNQGVEWPDALNHYMSGFPLEFDAASGTYKRKVPGESRTRAPLVTRFTNPNDLAATANEVALKRLGRRFSQEEMTKFVTSYQQSERGAAQQQYAAGDPAGGGGAYTDPMAVDTAANLAAEEADPVASMARNMLPLVQGVNEMLGEQFSEAANPMQGGLIE